jgi:hypothetical protein
MGGAGGRGHTPRGGRRIAIACPQRSGFPLFNASLGVPGWTLSSEWGNILTASSLNNVKHNFVLVKAAGNEGVSQTSDVAWPSGFGAPTNLLLVGSADPTAQISTFSNAPGRIPGAGLQNTCSAPVVARRAQT